MAKSSDSLTKYTSAETIVTADVANAWYGGLHGSAEGASLDPTDPLVAGHVHDGQHIDGHSQKIDLVEHVTDQLRNINLADDAVTDRNVQGFATQSDAIPEFEIIGGTTYYKLDLSDIRAGLGVSVFEYDAANDLVRYNESEGPSNTSTGFVVGAEQLDFDPLNLPARSRMFFDKLTGSFRAGISSDGTDPSLDPTSWDFVNRGLHSFGWGTDTFAAGSYSFSGGRGNSVNSSSTRSSILNGNENSIVSADLSSILGGGVGPFGKFTLSGNIIDNSGTDINNGWSTIVGGAGNSIITASFSSILGGSDHSISSGDWSSILGGYNNSISATNSCFIGSGSENSISEHSDGAILAGVQNQIGPGILLDGTESSVICAGRNNTILSGDYASIISGTENRIEVSDFASIISGNQNTIGSLPTLIPPAPAYEANYSVIAGGSSNGVYSERSIIGAGNNNVISLQADYSMVGTGNNNSIAGDFDNSVIGAGLGNAITNINSVGEPPQSSGILSGDSNDIVFARGVTALPVVNNAGSGYAVGDILQTLGGGYSEAKIGVTSVGGSGEVITAAILTGGYWDVDPTNPVSTTALTGSGTLATFDLTSVAGGQYALRPTASGILSGYNNKILGAFTGGISSGQNNKIQDNISSFIGGGDSNEITASAYSAVLSGRDNLITGVGINPAKVPVPTLFSNTVVGGRYNYIASSASYGVAMGKYCYVNSVGMVAQASDSFTQGDSPYEGAGEAQTSVLTFVGESGSSADLINLQYQIYLNNIGVMAGLGSVGNTTGYPLFIPNDTVGGIRWFAVGKRDVSSVQVLYEGFAEFQRSLGDVVVLSNSATSVGALPLVGGTTIKVIKDPKSAHAVKNGLIFSIDIPAQPADPYDGGNMRWLIRAEVVWVKTTFG